MDMHGAKKSPYHEAAEAFEAEVRATARALWDALPGEGAPINVDGRERDCLFLHGEVIQYIECTTSRTLEKVRHDCEKMVAFREKYKRNDKFVRLWMITREEPTPDQSSHARKYNVIILSLAEFAKKIFDGDAYIRARASYRFGSATDPESDSMETGRIKYIATRIEKDRFPNEAISLPALADALTGKAIVSVVGEYGAGKSLLVRELFLKLANKYRKSPEQLPIAINLQEHWGQSDCHEALSRHARKLGVNAQALIRLFNAGKTVTLLDGFDELASQPVARRSDLRSLRHGVLQLVRDFIQHSRGKQGVLIVGRNNFFDDIKELRTALEFRQADLVFHLRDFTDAEAKTYLSQHGINFALPDWLPRRPLLLAYLVHNKIFDEVREALPTDPSAAWSRLIDLICEREARIHQTYLDRNGVRDIMERLADKVRTTNSGIGPITSEDVVAAYKAVVGGDEPDDGSKPLLMRLPGLSSRNHIDGSREFVDENLLSTLAAGSVARFIHTPHSDPKMSQLRHGLTALGVEVARIQLEHAERPSALAEYAAGLAARKWNSPTLSLDCLCCAIELTEDDGGEEVTGGDCVIREGCCKSLDLSRVDVSHVTFEHCEFDSVIISAEQPRNLRFENCMITTLRGASRREDLPAWIDGSNEVGQFDAVPTNALIMRNETIPLAVRVMMTILRKLYIQGGGGRQENALFRGMPNEARALVPDILARLRTEKLVYEFTVRGHRICKSQPGADARVHRMLEQLMASSDPLIAAITKLDRA